MVGALAALCSNFFFGQGPWTPWQMYAWGLVGYVAGVLANTGVFALGERLGAHGPSLGTIVLLCYGFLSGLGYGFILNSWYIVAFLVPVTWQGALAAYLAGLPLDLVHSVATVPGNENSIGLNASSLCVNACFSKITNRRSQALIEALDAMLPLSGKRL